ncbi:hypothetical protein TWF694_009662 [Orbilia ellipsospora]|uniref:Uncharacterized protein n=1 Tax=Orbilia ellipsospora TaxID=2528407 RepID=A0AAV9XBI1_9PEZI
MPSLHSASSCQSLVNQALGVSANNIAESSSKPRIHGTKTRRSPTSCTDSLTTSASKTRSSSSRESQRPVGNIAEAASSETPAPTPPKTHSSNTSPCPTCNQPSPNIHRDQVAPREDDFLFGHTAFSMADAPVPGGYEPVVSLPIALFIPPRHIPELWNFPDPQPPCPAPNSQEADLEGDWYWYTLQCYLAESYTEDPYPLRCRLHFRQT